MPEQTVKYLKKKEAGGNKTNHKKCKKKIHKPTEVPSVTDF